MIQQKTLNFGPLGVYFGPLFSPKRPPRQSRDGASSPSVSPTNISTELLHLNNLMNSPESWFGKKRSILVHLVPILAPFSAPKVFPGCPEMAQGVRLYLQQTLLPSYST